MVYGINHVAALKATYQNITVYATGREVHGKLVGEANAFVGGISDNYLTGTPRTISRLGILMRS